MVDFPLVPTLRVGMHCGRSASVTMKPSCDTVSSHKHNRSPGQNVEISKVSPELYIIAKNERKRNGDMDRISS